MVDEGPGVAPDQVRHLFQRTPTRPKEKQPVGLGLGLYVAAAAIRMHRGTIDYAPGPRGGASFTVR